jgi:hypothetical protein
LPLSAWLVRAVSGGGCLIAGPLPDLFSLLMMLEAACSITLAALVIARAINIL